MYQHHHPDDPARPPESGLVTTAEAAQMLGLSENGFRKLLAKGAPLTRWTLAGYWVRYSRAEVLALVEARAPQASRGQA